MSSSGNDDDTKELFGSESENEIKELFGSESEGDDVNKETSRKKLKRKNQEEDKDSLSNDDGDLGLGTDDAMEEESDQEEYVLETQLPEMTFPLSEHFDGYYAKLPAFLDIEETPFDPKNFIKVDDEAERLRSENTIRWRYRRDENGALTGRESNSRIIRWSDGSLSLLLGQELLKIQIQELKTQQQYLTAIYPQDGYLQMQHKVEKSISIRPYSMSSITHRKFTRAVASKHRKEKRAKMYVIQEDPEKLVQQIEKAEMEKVRARRRVEAQRQQYEMDLTADLLERAPKTNRYEQQYYEEEEEEDDGFIVHSDEEEEEESDDERTKRIEKSKNKVDFSSEEEEEEEESEEESDDLEIPAAKLRKIVDDDESD